jgi:hypothetical protein
MSESSFGSLSPTLLARKGAARPAMRPQLGAVAPDALAKQIDDLGWNDMGEDADEAAPVAAQSPAQVVPIIPDTIVPIDIPPPAVHDQHEEVKRRMAPQPRRTVPVAAPDRRSALADGRRAAFTLRVDSERHLKLRLACAIRNRSAQQLVTEALDRLLDELPDVTDLAAQVGRNRP